MEEKSFILSNNYLSEQKNVQGNIVPIFVLLLLSWSGAEILAISGHPVPQIIRDFLLGLTGGFLFFSCPLLLSRKSWFRKKLSIGNEQISIKLPFKREWCAKAGDIESIIIESSHINIRLHNKEHLSVIHHLPYSDLLSLSEAIQSFRITYQIPAQLHTIKTDEPVRFLDIPYENDRRKFWSNWSWLNALLWVIMCVINITIYKNSAIANFDLVFTVIFLISGLLSYFGEDKKFFEIGIAGIRFRKPFHHIEQYSWTKIKDFELEPSRIIVHLENSEHIIYHHTLSYQQLQEFKEVVHRLRTNGFFIGKTAS